MRRRRRRELFPPDRRLQVRMLLSGVGTPLIVAALLVAVAVLLPLKVLILMGVAAALGTALAVGARRRAEHPRVCTAAEEPELHAIVDRLCVVADLPRPDIVIDAEQQPNSWMLDLPARPPRLHVTEGLLELLEPAEV